MAAQLIKLVRVFNLEVVYIHGEKTVVQVPKMEREPEYENYDIHYDGAGRRQMVRRCW